MVKNLPLHLTLGSKVAPLFGTGSLTLIDQEEDESTEDFPEAKRSQTGNYGSIDPDEESGIDPKIAISALPGGSNHREKKTVRVSEIVITESGRPEVPRRNCLLALFNFIEGCGVLTSLCLMLTQVMPIILIPVDEIGAMSLVLKIYVSIFCLLFIMVECDVPITFLRNASFLQAYFSRGFLYSFLGISCLEEAYSERVKDMVAHARDQFHVAWFSLFMQVSSWMMLALGLSYMVFGLCCLKRFRDMMAEDYRQHWADYKEALKVYKSQRD